MTVYRGYQHPQYRTTPLTTSVQTLNQDVFKSHHNLRNYYQVPPSSLVRCVIKWHYRVIHSVQKRSNSINPFTTRSVERDPLITQAQYLEGTNILGGRVFVEI